MEYGEGIEEASLPDLEKVENILAVLSLAGQPEDMNLPGFHLHPLKGDRKGFWSVTVRANWRIIFRFHEGDAEGHERLTKSISYLQAGEF